MTGERGHTLVIEFEVSVWRTAQYESYGEGLEVLYVGTGAPNGAFAWEQIGLNRRNRPRGRVLQGLALRHALRYAKAGHWIAVAPPVPFIIPLARLAARLDTPLSIWLREPDTPAWLFFLVARAVGYPCEALFLDDGWQLFIARKRNAKEAA